MKPPEESRGAPEPSKTEGTDDERVDDEVLDEGCHYLSKLNFSNAEIAERFGITKKQVTSHKSRFERRLAKGELQESDEDLSFWKDVKMEAEGNIKITFVSGKGFHHAWRTDLQKLDGPTLLSIYESCKGFLDMDPNARFIEYAAPKNYDPLAMQREVRKAMGVVNSILEEKWKAEKGESSS